MQLHTDFACPAKFPSMLRTSYVGKKRNRAKEDKQAESSNLDEDVQKYLRKSPRKREVNKKLRDYVDKFN